MQEEQELAQEKGQISINTLAGLLITLKAHIVSFAAQAESVESAIKEVSRLALVNKDFSDLANNTEIV